MHELYLTLTAAGFTKDESLTIIAKAIAAQGGMS